VITYDKDGGPAGALRSIYLLHGARLARYGTGEAERLIAILDAANKDIKALILRAKSIDTKKQYARVAAEIRAITKQLNEQLYGQLRLDLEELAAEETAFVEKSLKSIGLTADLGLSRVSPQRVWAAASFGSYAADGHETFETYLNGLSENLYKTWDIACRAAYLTGTPAKAIVKNVLGTINTEEMELDQVQRLRNSLSANTQTMISSMAEQARDAVYRENSSLFDYYVRLETLDNRTCLACAAEDLKRYPDLDKAPTLPAHLRCRGLYLPHVKGMPEYMEGDERAAAGGPVPAKMTYRVWFETLNKEQKLDILGPGRYKLYQRGMEITSFVPDGRILTLKELAEK
jgi:hypothetical protein